MFGFQFRSVNGCWLMLSSITIPGIPVVLWVIRYVGDCVVSSSGSYCKNILDFSASVLFAFEMFQVFGFWIISAALIVMSVIMLALAVFLELAARRNSRPKSYGQRLLWAQCGRSLRQVRMSTLRTKLPFETLGRMMANSTSQLLGFTVANVGFSP